MIDEMVHHTSFSSVMELIFFLAYVTKRAIGPSFVTFQSGTHMDSNFITFFKILNSN